MSARRTIEKEQTIQLGPFSSLTSMTFLGNDATLKWTEEVPVDVGDILIMYTLKGPSFYKVTAVDGSRFEMVGLKRVDNFASRFCTEPANPHEECDGVLFGYITIDGALLTEALGCSLYRWNKLPVWVYPTRYEHPYRPFVKPSTSSPE